MNINKKKALLVSEELILDILLNKVNTNLKNQLPNDVTITTMTYDYLIKCFIFVLTSDEFPELSLGEDVPLVKLMYNNNTGMITLVDYKVEYLNVLPN